MTTDIFELIYNNLNQGQPVVLATVISQHGSSPRSAGTRMVISQDGACHGTIGGGLMEAKVMEKASEAVLKGQSGILSFDLSHQDIAALDMICGGRVDVLVDRISPEPEMTALFQRLTQARREGDAALFISFIPKKAEWLERVERCLVLPDGDMLGSHPLSSSRLDEITAAGQSSPFLQVIPENDGLIVVQPLVKPYSAVIFGAGHVARPTAHMAAMVGFQVTVIDDRAEFAAPDRFPDAFEVRAIADFNQALSDVPVDEQTFIIIVTRGHFHDLTVLAQSLRTPAGYIGMIGSRRKRKIIYDALLKQGFTQDDLNRVHSPIGLSIGAETPEEIGVSIVSEMIQVRAELRK